MTWSPELDTQEKWLSIFRNSDRSEPSSPVDGLAREAIRRIVARDSAIGTAEHHPDREELVVLCMALLSEDDSEAARIIAAARTSGASPETIYLRYLAAAARMLGEWWVEDRVNFVDVTVGTGRIFAIMRDMRDIFEPTGRTRGATILFASLPGEQHSLGVRMAADMLSRDGWNISLKIGLDHDDLLDEIVRSPDRIVAVSVGGRHALDAASLLASDVRLHIPSATLIAGGHGVQELEKELFSMGFHAVVGEIHDAKEKLASLRDRRPAAKAGAQYNTKECQASKRSGDDGTGFGL